MAKRWLDSSLNGAETLGFVWVVLLAFVLLFTHPALFPHPLRLDDAMKVIEAWLSRPAAVVLNPTDRHVGVMHGLLGPLGIAANMVNDAHLATIALEHGADVVSFDTDFARFEGLRWRAPGAE